MLTTVKELLIISTASCHLRLIYRLLKKLNFRNINRVLDDYEFESKVDYSDRNVVHLGIWKSAR